jgi:hypothetical protein
MLFLAVTPAPSLYLRLFWVPILSAVDPSYKSPEFPKAANRIQTVALSLTLNISSSLAEEQGGLSSESHALLLCLLVLLFHHIYR